MIVANVVISLLVTSVQTIVAVVEMLVVSTGLKE